MLFGLTCCLLTLAGVPAWAAQSAATPNLKTLLQQYQAARGGAKAWRDMLSMGWTGRIESAGGKTPKLSFLMLFQRPDATRFEIIGRGQRSIRIFDGHEGWKVRPGSETGLDVHPYTDDELVAARDSGGIDGPLVDSAKKGIAVALEGADTVEGHKAWRLRVTLPSGQVQRHWLDAATHLELRYDRVSSNAAGQSELVSVYYRDYQTLEGITLPMVIETRAGNGPAESRMVIEKVAVNPTLDAGSFIAPMNQEARHGGVIVDTRR